MVVLARSSSTLLRLYAAILFVSSIWTLVLAQDQVIAPCIIACVQPIAIQNGCMFQNTTCVCGNAKFQSEAAVCLHDKCTSEENQQALDLQKRQCGPLGITPTTPPPGPSTSVYVVTAPTTAPTRATTPPPPGAVPTTASQTASGAGSQQTNAGWAVSHSAMNLGAVTALALMLGSMFA